MGGSGFAFMNLVGLALRPDHRQARNGRELAPESIPLVLDLEDPSRSDRPTSNPQGDSRSDPNHEPDERTLGSASNSQRTPQAGNSDFAGFCCQVHGPPSDTVIANMENLPHQSRIATGLSRLLHGTHHLVRYSVCLCRSCPMIADASPFQRHGSSNRGLDCAPNRSSLPFRQRNISCEIGIGFTDMNSESKSK